jgi:hypothetical protein
MEVDHVVISMLRRSVTALGSQLAVRVWWPTTMT